MDFIDLDADFNDKILELQIRHAARTPTTTHENTCLNCDADLVDERKRYCDVQCQHDHEKRRKIHRRQRGE
jgi:hypothetical protein